MATPFPPSGRDEALYRELVDRSPALMYRTDSDGGSIYLNRRWLEFRGVSREDELGDGWLQGIHPDDVPALTRHFSDQVARRAPVELEYRVRRHDGQYRWVLDTATPIFGERGEFTGYAGAVIDITERRAAEARLRETLDRERALHEREAALLQELNHRVRNNLAGLLGLIAVYEQRHGTGELSAALRGKVRAMAEVHDLLAGGASIDLATLAQRLADASPLCPDAGSQRVSLDGPMVPLSPPRAQAVAIIFQELLTNSRKHGALGSGGSIAVRWSVVDRKSGRADQAIDLRWEERGGPPPRLEHRGVGLSLIEGLARSELRGRAGFGVGEAGVTCTIQTDVS